MEKTMGEIIASERKIKNITQAELAKKLCVTDKAVSKWERNVSCPDVMLLSKLANELNISIEELLQCKTTKPSQKEKISQVISLILKAIPTAMGIAVVVISLLGEIQAQQAFTLLGIGIASAGVAMLIESDKSKE